MRIFKTKAFDKFAQKNHITDSELFEAVMRAEQGLIDADLGGNIIKQRIAREGQGRSGGFRSFVAAISKNARANISVQELTALKELAKAYAKLTPQQIESQVKNGLFIEVLPERKNE